LTRIRKPIRATFERFLIFGDGPTDAIIVDNDEWLSGLNYIEFLRDYGRHFSVNRMMGFESVKLRLEREQPLSFLEFNYMILQAYDFLELNRRYDCSLQMGGSDQWGNIVNGIELTRRCDQKSVYGLTTNLLTTSSGAKMGKTAQGAVWLNDDMLTVYDYWQFWRNTEDADVGRFLKLFTELPIEEIARLENLEGAELNDAKKILATEATAMCHGRAAAEKAEATALETFEGGGTSADLPSIDIDAAKLEAGLGLLEAFVLAGLAKSNGEARRLVQGGGAKINDAAQDDISVTLSNSDVKDGSVKLSFGKKRHVLLRPV
jgi:tyrosyl-tRNA synthetase